MTATVTEPDVIPSTTDPGDRISHFICGNCYEEDGVEVTYCGNKPNEDDHWCTEDLSCGCTPCPLCYTVVEENRPCRRCGR